MSVVSSVSRDVEKKATEEFQPNTAPDEPDKTGCWDKRKCCRNGLRFWCWKYFWEGQIHDGSELDKYMPGEEDNRGPFTNLSRLKRKAISVLLPAAVIHICWWAVMIKHGWWYVFPEKYYMSITMIFGSMVAGMTSEGGGAVAFPVMTLALGVNPKVARDFSVMIQSFGMSCASFTLNFMQVRLENNLLVWSSLGGFIGTVVGLEVIEPRLSPPAKKMGFVSIWFSFAFALFLLNRNHKRKTFQSIQQITWWKILILILTGLMGGIFTSFAGSGLDICSFSIVTLLFRVSEKVATPTSILLMAANSIFVFFWRGLVQQDISVESWEYVLACIPIVVIGAPTGSFFGSHFHRLVLAAFIYILDTVALVSAFIIVPLTPALIGGSVGIIVGGFIFFLLLTKAGERMVNAFERRMYEVEEDDRNSVTGVDVDNNIVNNI